MTTTDHDTCRTYAAWLGRTPEEDGMDFYEPYRLEVGQRVLIVAVSECPFCEAIQSRGALSADGLTGRIEQDRWPIKTFLEYGHSYLVRLDEPLVDANAPNGYWLLSHHALGELVPIDDAAQQQQRRADGAGE